MGSLASGHEKNHGIEALEVVTVFRQPAVKVIGILSYWYYPTIHGYLGMSRVATICSCFLKSMRFPSNDIHIHTHIYTPKKKADTICYAQMHLSTYFYFLLFVGARRGTCTAGNIPTPRDLTLRAPLPRLEITHPCHP